jgi:serine/threonine-protein kinase
LPSTFFDLFVAKVAIQLGLFDPPGACAALRAVDQTAGGLLDHLSDRLAVAPATVKTVERHARRCLFLKGEAIYLRFLRERGWVDDEKLKPLLWTVRAHPHDGRDVRLGALLVQGGLITAEQDRETAAQMTEALERDNDSVTARYRERGYVGVEQNSQTVAEVISAAAQAPPPDRAQPPSAGLPRPRALPPAEPRPPQTAALSSSNTMILTPEVASGLQPMEAAAAGSQPPARPPALGRELAGDLGLSRESPVVAVEERTAELAVAAGGAPAAVGVPELARTGLNEKFDVVRKLGEGGMGAVYLAFAKDDLARERPMALKVVLDIAKSKDAAARFKREILATSMCAHENIIEIHDAAETEDGSFFMAMEYVAGEQLDEVLKREGPLSIPRVVDLVEQALEGLEAVHRANIVHRDIKPQNFRIWRDKAGRERLKIMDFGIARVLDADDSGQGDQFFHTMAGKITGSPAYIPPESIVGETIDGRSDLYSLGISIYRIATGRLPFVAKTPDEYLPMHLYKKPPPLREVLPDSPPELEAFALRLLEKAPAKRPKDAGEALAELREKVRPALVREGFGPATADTAKWTNPAAANPAETTPASHRNPASGTVEATAADRGAVPFSPAPGPTEQVRVVDPSAPPRAPLEHEVAATHQLTAEEAAAQVKALEAEQAAAKRSTSDQETRDEPSPVRRELQPPKKGGKGKLVAALILLVVLGVAAAVGLVLYQQQQAAQKG